MADMSFPTRNCGLLYKKRIHSPIPNPDSLRNFFTGTTLIDLNFHQFNKPAFFVSTVSEKASTDTIKIIPSFTLQWSSKILSDIIIRRAKKFNSRWKATIDGNGYEVIQQPIVDKPGLLQQARNRSAN